MKSYIIEQFQSYKKFIAISLISNIIVVGLFTFVLHETGYLSVGTNPSVTAGLLATNNGQSDDAVHESRIVDIVDKTSPAVVSIIISKDVPVVERYYQNVDPFAGFGGFGSIFGNSFGGFSVPQYRQKGTEKKEIGGGSGFFVSDDGLIVTNRHVVSDDNATYTVFTNDGKKYDAKVLTKDTLFDIALLRIEGQNFPYLEFGNSDKVRPGQTAIAIGNTLAEFRNSVSVGVISGISRSLEAGDQYGGSSEHLNNVIQTDAAINPGNSGGPLLNLSGQVVGVNVAAATGSENVGFALPSNTIKTIVQSVKQHGSIVRPYLGIRYIAVTDELVEKNNLPIDYGVLVLRGETPADLAVIPGSPADKAGVSENDIITAVDGVELREGVQLNEVIGQKGVGDTVKLDILRKGEKVSVTVKLEKMPKAKQLLNPLENLKNQ